MPPDKRRKIGSARTAAGVASVGRGRQPLVAVNNRQDVVATASDMGGAEGECESVEFKKEEVEALLNEKIKGKKFDVKVRFLLVCFSLR